MLNVQSEPKIAQQGSLTIWQKITKIYAHLGRLLSVCTELLRQNGKTLATQVTLHRRQGDQIVWPFAHWVDVYFGQVF
jgi:hypothetical protein